MKLPAGLLACAVVVGLHALGPVWGDDQEDRFLSWYQAQRWRDARDLSLDVLQRQPGAQLWLGYAASSEFQLGMWLEAFDHLERLRWEGGMRDLTQLGMSWEAAIHLDLLEEAQRRLEEIQARFPSSELASLAASAGSERLEGDSPLSDAQEHLRRLLSDQRIAMAQDSPARAASRLRFETFQWRQQGRQGAALSAGLSSLRLQAGLRREVDVGLSLELADLALVLDATVVAQDLLAALAPAAQGWRASLLQARLHLRLSHRDRAEAALRECLTHSHDLGILASAHMLEDRLQSLSPLGSAQH